MSTDIYKVMPVAKCKGEIKERTKTICIAGNAAYREQQDRRHNRQAALPEGEIISGSI